MKRDTAVLVSAPVGHSEVPTKQESRVTRRSGCVARHSLRIRQLERRTQDGDIGIYTECLLKQQCFRQNIYTVYLFTFKQSDFMTQQN
jgi:predicted nucleotidyltransferase